MLDPNMAVVLNNALSLAEMAGAYEKKASDVIASYQHRDQMAAEKRASTLRLLVDLGFVPQGREKEAADLLGIPYDKVTQGGLFPIAYTIGTDFKPAKREPLSKVLHWDKW